MWDLVAVSSGRRSDTTFFAEQLEKRRKDCPKWSEQLGLSPVTMIVPVPDPFTEDSSRKETVVGSGGAALNAILHVAEHISARGDSGNILCRVFNGWRVVVLLCGVAQCKQGGSELGKAFAPLPLGPSETLTTGGISNAELALLNLSRVADLSPSLWITSTEWIMHVPPGFASPFTAPSPDGPAQITALALPAPVAMAESHGVYKLGEGTNITNVFFRPGEEVAEDRGAAHGGQVLIVAPVVRFCERAAEAFLALHTQSPFDACTYHGSDSASQPVRLNLYLDVLRACTTAGRDCKRDEIVAASGFGASSPTLPNAEKQETLSREARHALIRVFSKVSLKAAIPGFPPFFYSYPTTPESWLQALLDVRAVSIRDPAIGGGQHSHSTVHPTASVAPGSVVFRSWLDKGVVVGEGSLVLAAQLGEGVVVGKGCRVYHCVLEAGTSVPDGTHLGATDALDCARLGVTPAQRAGVEDSVAHVVDDDERAQRVRSSLEQHGTMLLADKIDLHEVTQALMNGWDTSLSGVLLRLAHSSVTPMNEVLATLDNLIVDVQLSRLARVLYSVADFLSHAAKGGGGLRSGPARNPRWLPALEAIQRWDGSEEGRKAWAAKLSHERARWLGAPESLIRAARHYEGAAAVITARCVDSSSQFVTYTEISIPPLGEWVRASSPARIDLAGGWTDTPPVSFEAGGLVVNVAIKVNGIKPLQAFSRRLNEPLLRLWTDSGEVIVEHLHEMLDFCSPQAPAAILKAALVALNVIEIHGDPLRSQLLNMGGGLEIRTSSTLPMGSGLGGSSILGGVLLSAVAAAIGRNYSRDALVHAVLRLEQLLTSGGGWQDQVGGFFGGIKMCNSSPSLPLQVHTKCLQVQSTFLAKLSQHIELVYTGRARLARNLLQGVLRRWAARLPEVVSTVADLRGNAAELINAVTNEDIGGVGECVSRYWKQKQKMAGSGVEPLIVPKVSAHTCSEKRKDQSKNKKMRPFKYCLSYLNMRVHHRRLPHGRIICTATPSAVPVAAASCSL